MVLHRSVCTQNKLVCLAFLVSFLFLYSFNDIGILLMDLFIRFLLNLGNFLIKSIYFCLHLWTSVFNFCYFFFFVFNHVYFISFWIIYLIFLHINLLFQLKASQVFHVHYFHILVDLVVHCLHIFLILYDLVVKLSLPLLKIVKSILCFSFVLFCKHWDMFFHLWCMFLFYLINLILFWFI